MVVLTPLTIIVELLPAVVITFIYLVFFQKKRNRYIEFFTILMYVKAIQFFLYGIYLGTPQGGFDPIVDSNTLWMVLITDFIFHIAYCLQEYLTWIMVSFLSVIMGIFILIVKLALQDPMKRKFSNLLRKVTGKEPETDEFSGLSDRLNNIRFNEVEPQPLDNEIQSKLFSESWKDYLIIGLATLLPSISFYIGSVSQYALIYTDSYEKYLESLPNAYVFGVMILVIWIYRFGFPASNRIAKGAGVKLGERKLGDEMMRGVLGWFFRLNLLLTIATVVIDILSISPDLYYILFDYYRDGLIKAITPMIFAILILPLVEAFSVHLYKHMFENITNLKSKVGGIQWRNALANIAGSIITGAIATFGIVLAVMGVTLSYAYNNGLGYQVHPGLIDTAVNTGIGSAVTNSDLISGTNWVLLMLSIPLGFALLVGVIAHYVRKRITGSTETFAFIMGLVVTIGVWYFLPGLDYVLGAFVGEAVVGGESFYRLIPFVNNPEGVEVIYRIAYQLIVNLPFIISSALFVLYYLEFKDKKQLEEGNEIGPLLNVTQRDVLDVVAMFGLGLIASFIGVYVFALIINNPGVLYDTILGLIYEIGEPNGLEYAFSLNVSIFVLIVEHNIIRTLMMLVIGPVFWSIALWFVAAKSKTEGEKKFAWFSVAAVIFGSVLAYVWTLSDEAAGVFVQTPGETWVFLAELGIRIVIVLGILIGIYILVAVFNKATGRGQNAIWFSILLTLFAIEYFVYDDQFTIISLVVLSFILAIFYELSGRGNDFLLSLIKMSLMSVAIAEVLSTALWVGGIAALDFYLTGNANIYLASIIPHAIVEIPAFLLAAALSIRIARNIGESVDEEDWDAVSAKTRDLLTDIRTWRSYIIVMFFLVIAALIETNITEIIRLWVQFG